MEKLRVLFLCVHNSGRSIMAEEFLRRFAGDSIEVESAGLEPAPAVNPLVVEAMAELGLDVSARQPKSVFDLFRQGRLFDYVISVCEEGSDRCPVFPGLTRRWSWPFPDPAAASGSRREQLEQVRAIRDLIREKVERPFAESAEDPVGPGAF